MGCAVLNSERELGGCDWLPAFDFVPKRFQIGICEGHRLDAGLIANNHGSAKPMAGIIELSHLAGVTGEIVWDCRFLRELFGSREQCVPCGFEATFGDAAEGVSLVKPPSRSAGVGLENRLGGSQGGRPILFGCVDEPKHLENFRCFLVSRINSGEFGSSFLFVAEFEPADGGGQIMNIWRFQRLH